jgi:uncharacterized protein YbjT (DUF2867 family)
MKRKVLITGATGDTGRAAVKESIKRGLHVRAMVHRPDDRSMALEKLGAEVVVGDLHKIDEIRQALEGTEAAYLVYPVAHGLIDATVYFAQAAKEAGVSAIVNLSQRSGPLGMRVALAWNVLGLLALTNVVIRAVLTSPGPLNLIHTEVPNRMFATFPFVFIPGFFVPLAVVLHLLSIRALSIRLRPGVK